MSLSLGELVGYIRADDSQFIRALDDSELRLRGFTRMSDGQLRDMHGNFVSEGDAMGRALGNGIADGSNAGMLRMVADADLQLRGLTRMADGRIRDMHGNFLSEGEAMGRGLGDNINGGADSGMLRMVTNARRHLITLGDDVDNQSGSMFRRLVTRSGQAGDDSGRGLGHRMLDTLTSVLSSGMGEALTNGMSGIQSAISSVQSSPMVGQIGTAMAVGVVATLLPMIGALLAGAVIAVGGLSIIGVGAMLLKDEPKVKSAASRLMGTVKGVFDGAAKPLIRPFVDALDSMGRTLQQLKPQIDALFAASAGFVKPLSDGMQNLVTNAMPGFLSMMQNGQPVFDALKSVLSDIGTGLGSMFQQIGKQGPEAGQALRDLGSAIKFLLEVVGLTIATLADAYGHIRSFITNTINLFQGLYDKLVGHSIIPDTVNAIVRWFAGLPGRAWSALSSLGSRISGRASDAGAAMVSAIRSKLTSAVSWVNGLPGRVRDALGDLSGYLYNSGSSLISGFINGMKSMASSAGNAAGDLLSQVRDYFPFSPARKGPFSGQGWVTYSGAAMATALASGMASGEGAVSAAALSLMGTAQRGLAIAPGTPMANLVSAPSSGGRSGAGGGSGSSGAGGQTITVRNVLDVTGADSDMLQMIRKMVRTNGQSGSVQHAFGYS